ncbi:hypothetical protein BH11VER1_BH11VER1_36460 [soil metagenome]
MKALLEGEGSKIDEQPNREVHQAQVGEELFAMDRGELLDGLEFHDHAAFYEKIGTESLLENHFVIFKPDDLLPFHLETPFFQSPGQDHLINRLQQPGPGVLMDLDGGVNDGSGDVIEVMHGRGSEESLTRSRGERGGFIWVGLIW